MIKKLLKQVFQTAGFELRKAPDPTLPFIHRIQIGSEIGFDFWIANPHAKQWWAGPAIPWNAELRMLAEFTRPGALVFDVGAHHGFTAALFAEKTGNHGAVYAFEANPANALTLCANVGLNGYTQIKPVFAAVGDKGGHIAIADESVTSAGGRKVTVVTLDDYWAQIGRPAVSVLKIDVEGFEAHVLRGAKALLETRPNLALEIHFDELGKYGVAAVDLFRLLPPGASEMQIMVRPDWDSLKPIQSYNEIPPRGVANLFVSYQRAKPSA